MSNISKGRAKERELKKLLEKAGFIVCQAPMTKYGMKDYFGLFDLIAIKQDVYFIQVKSRYIKKVWEKIKEWHSSNKVNAECVYAYYTKEKNKIKWTFKTITKGKEKMFEIVNYTKSL